MQKSKIFLFFTFLILLSTCVFAVDSRVLYWWDCEDSNMQGKGSRNVSFPINMTESIAGVPLHLPGALGNGCYFDGDDNYIEQTGNINTLGQDAYTVVYIWNSTIKNAVQFQLVFGGMFAQYQHTSGDAVYSNVRGNSAWNNFNYQYNATQTTMSMRTFNSSGNYHYICALSGCNMLYSNTDTALNFNYYSSGTDDDAAFGSTELGVSFHVGMVDEVAIFNDTFSFAEVTTLYEGVLAGLSYKDYYSPAPTNPSLSAYNVTSENIKPGEDSSAWAALNSSMINVTNQTLSLTLTTNIDANCTGILDRDDNFSTALSNNTGYLFATTSTTAHSYLVFDNITQGQHCLYVHCVEDSDDTADTGSGCLNFTSNFKPICTVVYNSTDLQADSTGMYAVTINCTDDHGLNMNRTGNHYDSFVTRTVDSDFTLPNRWNIFYPENNISVKDSVITRQILRAQGRNETYWYEDENFFNNSYTYAVNDGEYGHYEIVENGSTWATINFTGQLEHLVFKQSAPLNFGRLTNEDKTNQEFLLTKNVGLLVRVFDLEKMKNTEDYITTLFGNFNYSGLPSKGMDISYCNQTFRDVDYGVVKPHDSTSCVSINTLSTLDLIAPREFSDGNSSYINGTYGVNNGSIGGILTTDIAWVYFSTTQTGSHYYTMRFANGSDTTTNVSFNSTRLAYQTLDDGLTFTDANLTPDIFINQREEGDIFELGVYIEDNIGNAFNNFTLYLDPIGDADFPISPPSIHSYDSPGGLDLNLNGSHFNNMTISVIMSKDPDTVGFVEHNLTLRYPNGSLAYIINGSFNSSDDSDLNITFDTTSVNQGLYKMNITANYSTDFSTYLTFENFTIGKNKTANSTLCPLMDILRFRPNVSNFNYTLGNMTANNTKAYNFSFCNYTYNVTNDGIGLLNISMNMNVTNTGINMTCNNTVSIDTIPRRIFDNVNSYTGLLLNCTMDYLNTTNATKFNVSFTDA